MMQAVWWHARLPAVRVICQAGSSGVISCQSTWCGQIGRKVLRRAGTQAMRHHQGYERRRGRADGRLKCHLGVRDGIWTLMLRKVHS